MCITAIPWRRIARDGERENDAHRPPACGTKRTARQKAENGGPASDEVPFPSGRGRQRAVHNKVYCTFALISAVMFPLFLLLFALSSFAPFSSPALAATVASVIDGDTVVLTDGTKVRYLGINTPERGQPFYEEAKRFNEQLVQGEEVRLENRRQGPDTYGRVLAYVYVGAVLVNARLIAEGLGHLFVIGSLDHYEEWLRLQKDAQEQRKGMWGQDGVPGPLRITTVHADAEGDDRRNPNGEYVRICSVSDTPVELHGFSIQDAARHRYIFPGGTLKPGYTALLLSGRGEDTERRGQLLFYWGSGPIWNNSGDTASLFDPDGKLIDSFLVHREVDE